jgi:hypothetical protein
LVKKTLVVVLALVLVGIAVGIYKWNEKAPKVENAHAVSVTAAALAAEYAADEKNADTKYLNKAIEVSGTVSEVDNNQDGGSMIVLQTSDPTAGVQCSMRDKGATAAKGQQVTIKGFCSGNGITGVSLTSCVLK